ncbi:MAG: hypothetical protein HRT66_02110 [Flavobacteriaceae bacterium]|nr:hypothetical protein [Flavobacteriaceae bacterium]
MIKKTHSFHIPVMGLAFTIDSPIKIAKYGISSTLSIVDDILIETMNKWYSSKYKFSYKPVSDKEDDFRAKRITNYLNLSQKIVKQEFEKLKQNLSENAKSLQEYFYNLPDISELKQNFEQTFVKNKFTGDIKHWLSQNLSMGSIDVNIMTKLDKENFKGKEALESIHNDAHSALRGFANSDLESSLVLSAGMNPSLFSYMEQFEDFYPTENNFLKKKIILKVSDYRSALIQAQILAKKGIWVSEYRIESGLNCGGHAFATNGLLMGPILEEFKSNRQQLIEQVHSFYTKALEAKGRYTPKTPLKIEVTAQGGMGTSEEHNFMLDNYGLDSVGWGTPFLLVPEATTVDNDTREKLCKATEKDLYLSDASPLGVPFNILKDTSNYQIRKERKDQGKIGSACLKKYLVSSKEYSVKSTCTASRTFQKAKIKEIINLNLDAEKQQQQIDKVEEKTCLCVGLSNSSLIEAGIEEKGEKQGVVICPGPNMAYFSEEISLSKMIGHIYGKNNVMKHKNRPHVFIKELDLYIDYFKKQLSEITENSTKKQINTLKKFKKNLLSGVEYYKGIFNEMDILEKLNIRTKKIEVLD